jgi:phage shock protein A
MTATEKLMGLYDRISLIARANLNAGNYDTSNEDPEKALGTAITDMQEHLVQLRKAAADTIATKKRLEQQFNQAESQSSEWQNRAMLELQKGNEELAREALGRQQTYNQTATALKQQLDQSSTVVANQKKDLMALESKLDTLKARAKAAKASEQLKQALNTVDTDSAIDAFEHMEDKILELESSPINTSELVGDFIDPEIETDIKEDVDLALKKLLAELDKPPSSKNSIKCNFTDISGAIGRIEQKLQEIEDLSQEAFGELAYLKAQLKHLPNA